MWSDRETEEDCLGFDSYVSTLADICLREDIAPLTLGIFGSWGSGKTSLMRMVKKRIDETSDSDGVKTLWFNAWRYEGKDEAQAALIHALLGKLSENKKLLDGAKDLFERLKKNASVLKLARFITKTAVTLTPDLAGLLDCFGEQSEKLAATMESFEADFEELLGRMHVERTVVFIDDLDRCQSDKVIETFETIKLFLNIPACTFVIGADADKIKRAIGDVYGVRESAVETFTKDYLEKIIQIPFRIPQQRPEDVTYYVGMLVLGLHVSTEGWKALLANRDAFRARSEQLGDALREWTGEHSGYFADGGKTVLEQLDAIMQHVGIIARGLRGNPRQIKRFLNILMLRLALAETEELRVDHAVLIKVLVIEYVWPKFFEALVDTLDPESGKCALLAEMTEAAGSHGEAESEMVANALQSVGLVAFLREEPHLEDVDLTPYLFLAQTGLETKRAGELVPLDEAARTLAERIASTDRLRSRAGALQAAAMPPEGVEAVIRAIRPHLVGSDDIRVQTNVITALDTICRTHPRFYGPALEMVSQLDVAGRQALAMAAIPLLDRAEESGQELPKGLRERLEKVGRLSTVLGRHKRGT